MENNQLPTISIVTPSYNQGKYLEETILSIIGQNYPKLEYIIIDGGSTDNSVEIINKYKSHLSYWVSEKDQGQSHAINKGLRKATGEIFNWINSDDTLNNDALFAIAEKYIERKSDYFIIAGNGYEIDESSKRIRERMTYRLKDSDKSINFDLGGTPIQQSIFFSKALFYDAGGINPLIRYPMDIELYYKMNLLMPDILLSSHFIANFRKHNQSKTVSEDYKMLIEKIKLLTYLAQYSENDLFQRNQISSYISSFSFRNITYQEKFSLLKTFILNTPFDTKNRYKYKKVIAKLFS